MKKFTLPQILPMLVLLVGFYSCAPKYGAHFTNSSQFHKSEVKTAAINPEDKSQETVQQAAPIEIKRKKGPLGTEYALASREMVIPVVPSPSIEKLVEKHENNVKKIENTGLEAKALKKELKKERKRARKEIKKQVKKEIKEIKDVKARDGEGSYVLMMILAVIIPPLAVGLTYGITSEFWISLLLTIIFWLPGAIYSLIVVNNYYK